MRHRCRRLDAHRAASAAPFDTDRALGSIERQRGYKSLGTVDRRARYRRPYRNRISAPAGLTQRCRTLALSPRAKAIAAMETPGC
jgi:hypothetical protein